MINSRNTLKTAVGAAAICAVAGAAAAASSNFDPPTILQSALLCPRGGDNTVNSTSIPVNHSNSNKKRTNRKSSKKSLNQDPHENESSGMKSFTSAKTTGDESSKTDPILEDLLNQQDFYAILGISKTATSSQIQKAYRKRAVITHPDKTGGDRRAFDKVSEAYDVLSDETKRSIYDRYGKKGLQQHQTGGFPSSRSAEDIFRHFFGQNTHVPRNRTVRYQLEVTLEDLYQGLTRSILVEQPNGRKKIQVHVPRGYSSGEAIVLSGEMDAHADATPGDLIFLLQQRPHDRFTRKGHDLALQLKITLQEAMSGADHEIVHLDGRRITLRSARRENDEPLWIQTGDVHVLKGEGMPKRDSMGEFGDLYVQYQVELPKATSTNRLTPEERQQLVHLLNKLEGKEDQNAKEDESIRILQKAKLSDFGTASGPYRHAHDANHHDEETNRSQQSFFWSSSGGFGNTHSFFGSRHMRNEQDDGSNVQCQQM